MFQLEEFRIIMVDVDAMLADSSMAYELKECNTIAAKGAVTLIVRYFVEQGDKQKDLFERVNKYDW